MLCWSVKNLEMIKEREEEAGAMGKVIRKFTYKGEVEIDSADDVKIEVRRTHPPAGVFFEGSRLGWVGQCCIILSLVMSHI